MLIVTTPATSQALTTLAAVKAALDVTGSNDDAFLSSTITSVSAVIARWCRRTFALETVTETCRLNRYQPEIVVSRFPVVTVTSVTIGGTALDSSEFETDSERGILYRLDANGKYVCWPSDVVVVEYSAGYVLPSEHERTLPEDIEKAAILLCKVDYYARNRDPLLKSDAVEGIITQTFWVGGSGLPPDVEMLLSPYRVVTLG